MKPKKPELDEVCLGGRLCERKKEGEGNGELELNNLDSALLLRAMVSSGGKELTRDDEDDDASVGLPEGAVVRGTSF